MNLFGLPNYDKNRIASQAEKRHTALRHNDRKINKDIKMVLLKRDGCGLAKEISDKFSNKTDWIRRAVPGQFTSLADWKE